MRVIVAGGRDIEDSILIRHQLRDALVQFKATVVLSGGCRGADKIGENMAEELGLPVELHPEDRGQHGKAAGPIRNRQMAGRADVLIALWDGHSSGTSNMVRVAKEYGVAVLTIRPGAWN